MKFTTPCFVRVEDAEKRRELIEFLNMIDRPYRKVVPLNIFPYIATFYRWHDNLSEESLMILREEMNDLIDCGNNIQLFKALAAMTDDRDDVNQWYVFAADYYFGEEDVYYHRGHVISGIDMIYVFED
jgi:hypothetical protein